VLVPGLIGLAEYCSGLPWVLVAVHMLGACLVWMMAVFVVLSLRARGLVAAHQATGD
jgi:cytochrome c oxidase assembly protein subunit 15